MKGLKKLNKAIKMEVEKFGIEKILKKGIDNPL